MRKTGALLAWIVHSYCGGENQARLTFSNINTVLISFIVSQRRELLNLIMVGFSWHSGIRQITDQKRGG